MSEAPDPKHLALQSALVECRVASRRIGLIVHESDPLPFLISESGRHERVMSPLDLPTAFVVKPHSPAHTWFKARHLSEQGSIEYAGVVLRVPSELDQVRIGMSDDAKLVAKKLRNLIAHGPITPIESEPLSPPRGGLILWFRRELMPESSLARPTYAADLDEYLNPLFAGELPQQPIAVYMYLLNAPLAVSFEQGSFAELVQLVQGALASHSDHLESLFLRASAEFANRPFRNPDDKATGEAPRAVEPPLDPAGPPPADSANHSAPPPHSDAASSVPDPTRSTPMKLGLDAVDVLSMLWNNEAVGSESAVSIKNLAPVGMPPRTGRQEGGAFIKAAERGSSEAKRHNLVDAKAGLGTWLTPEGIAVARARFGDPDPKKRTYPRPWNRRS